MTDKKGRNGRLFGDVTGAVVMAILFAVILLLVVFSASAYQHAVDVRDDNDNTRAVLSYVITAVKADNAAQISVEDAGGVPVLVIAGRETGYAQRIFERNGEIIEVYGKPGASLTAGEPVTIGYSDRFEMKMAGEELLEIRTDLGTSYIRIGGYT